jgi:hypothetical protein
MPIIQQARFKLATSSTEEGLDFAVSLLSGGIEAQAQTDSAAAPELAISLARYTQFRYVGELELAYEELVLLGMKCKNREYQRLQFWSQLDWVGQKMNLPSLEVATLA